MLTTSDFRGLRPPRVRDAHQYLADAGLQIGGVGACAAGHGEIAPDDRVGVARIYEWRDGGDAHIRVYGSLGRDELGRFIAVLARSVAGDADCVIVDFRKLQAMDPLAEDVLHVFHWELAPLRALLIMTGPPCVNRHLRCARYEQSLFLLG